MNDVLAKELGIKELSDKLDALLANQEAKTHPVPWYTFHQVALMLDVHPATITRRVDRNLIKGSHIEGVGRVIMTEDLPNRDSA